MNKNISIHAENVHQYHYGDLCGSPGLESGPCAGLTGRCVSYIMGADGSDKPAKE